MIPFNRLRLPSLGAVACALALLAGTATGTGCATDRQVIAQADQMHSALEPAVLEDEVLTNYLQEIGDRIIEAARESGPPKGSEEDNSWMFSDRMRFHFVNSKTVNAFTSGGNHMYVYTALFEQAKSEDELAAVMAHEFAHVYGRHVHKGMNRQYGALAAAAVAGGAGYALAGEEKRTEGAALGAGAGLLVAQFANMGFARKDEAEADDLGFKFYTRAGWDPHKFDDFFQQMIDKGYDKTPAYLSDHPTLQSRVEAAQRRTTALPEHADDWRRPAVASGQRFRDLQARSARLGKTRPSDTTLANSQELLQALPRSCIAPVEPQDAVQARERIARRAEAAEQRQQAQPQRR